MRMPVSIACTASCLLIAGPFAIFFVPYATFSFRREVSLAIPISTGKISAPIDRHIMLEVALPDSIFSETIAVTSCPDCVTPSSTTPLSAHITTSAFLSRWILSFPVIPAIRTRASSSLPRLCSGFAIESQCCLHRSIASCDGFLIFSNVSSRIMIVLYSSISCKLFCFVSSRTHVRLGA